MKFAPKDWQRQVLRGVVIGIAVVAAFQLGGMFMDSQWSKQTEKIFADNARLNRAVDSLQFDIALSTAIDSAAASREAVKTERIQTKAHAIAASVPDTCKPVVTSLVVYVDSLAASNDTLQSIIQRQIHNLAALNRSIDTLQVQNAKMESKLRAGAKSRDRLFGFIPLPSRTQSLFAGAVVGVVATVVVVR